MNRPKPPRILLLTGRPGSGKTTLIAEVAAALGRRAGGFYTRELRAGGRRVGFEVVTLDGRRGRLAHVDIQGPHRVGKYGVDLESFEATGVEALQRAVRDSDLVVVDEIGKMELLSDRFRRAVEEAVACGKPILATVMLAPHPWVGQLKSHPDARVVLLSPENRPEIRTAVLGWLEEIDLKAEIDFTHQSPG